MTTAANQVQAAVDPSPARKTAPSQRARARQQKILQVVREEIAVHGFDGVTMHDLAAKAGVVKKTLYNIYGGKDALLCAAVSELVSAYRHLPESVAPGFASVYASRQLAAETVVANPVYAVAMLQSLLRVPQQHPLVDVLLNDAVDFTAEHLQIEVRRGGLPAHIDCAEFARDIVAQGFGVVVLLAQNLLTSTDFHAASLRGLLLLISGQAQGDLQLWLAEIEDKFIWS